MEVTASRQDPTMDYFLVGGEAGGESECYSLPRDLFLYYPHPSEATPVVDPKKWEGRVKEIKDRGKLWAILHGLYHSPCDSSDAKWSDDDTPPSLCSRCLEVFEKQVLQLNRLRALWRNYYSTETSRGFSPSPRGNLLEKALEKTVQSLGSFIKARRITLDFQEEGLLAKALDELEEPLSSDFQEETSHRTAQHIHRIQYLCHKIPRKLLLALSFRLLHFANANIGWKKKHPKILKHYKTLIELAKKSKEELALSKDDLEALEKAATVLSSDEAQRSSFIRDRAKVEDLLKSRVDRLRLLDRTQFIRHLVHSNERHPFHKISEKHLLPSPALSREITSLLGIQTGRGNLYHGSFLWAHTQGARSEDEDAWCGYQFKTWDGSPVSILGVFDGHGGKNLSAYLKSAAPHLIQEEMERFQPRNAVEMAELLYWIPHRLDKKWIHARKNKDDISGSTLNMTIIWNNFLFNVNVGDSRTFLICDNQWKLLSDDATPTSEYYKKRLLDGGGSVRKSRIDVDRVNGQLALSRALGSLNSEKNPSRSRGLTSLPKIEVFDWSTLKDPILVTACDGLYETLTSEEVAASLYQSRIHQNALHEIVQHALYRVDPKTKEVRKSRDNISVLSMKIQKPRGLFLS